jgi:hypothetical protein
LQMQRRFWVSRVDVALDILTRTREEADALAQFLRQYLVLLWRRSGHMYLYETTLYWSVGRRQRNLARYADKPARSDERVPCCHLELRFSGSASVRRAGFEWVEDMLDCDLIGLVSRHVRLLEYDANRFATAFIRRTLAAERRQFLRRRTPLHPVMEQYRSRLKYRLLNIIKRTGLDTAQGFKDLFPEQAKKLKSYPIITVINTNTGEYDRNYLMFSMAPFLRPVGENYHGSVGDLIDGI